MLLADPPLDLAAGGKVKQLEDKKLSGEGQMCHRVEVEGPEGTAVYWIDVDTHVLRRYDFPLNKIRA